MDHSAGLDDDVHIFCIKQPSRSIEYIKALEHYSRKLFFAFFEELLVLKKMLVVVDLTGRILFV